MKRYLRNLNTYSVIYWPKRATLKNVGQKVLDQDIQAEMSIRQNILDSNIHTEDLAIDNF